MNPFGLMALVAKTVMASAFLDVLAPTPDMRRRPRTTSNPAATSSIIRTAPGDTKGRSENQQADATPYPHAWAMNRAIAFSRLTAPTIKSALVGPGAAKSRNASRRWRLVKLFRPVDVDLLIAEVSLALTLVGSCPRFCPMAIRQFDRRRLMPLSSISERVTPPKAHSLSRL